MDNTVVQSSAVPTLEVLGLKTYFFTPSGVAKAVDGVSFRVQPGEVMGLVGESGSGKSMTGYSIVGLVDAPGEVVAGQILFRGQDLRQWPEEKLRTLRGKRIAMIFQDPMMTLNPVMKIGTQMIETVLAHEKLSRMAARERARQALTKVGISSPDDRLEAYPHQFSGGMRQRVAIAMALLHKPDLIIADEPTTALDVTIQAQILAEMQALCRESGTSLIWITHDLSVVAGLADTVSVMYAGRIVESGLVEDVLKRPLHPYTQGLIDSLPARNPRGKPLRQIDGAAPSLLALPDGCAFRGRCRVAGTDCGMDPPVRELRGSEVRCWSPFAAQETQ
jgi:peptide/nickel transport system ATP-binding protein